MPITIKHNCKIFKPLLDCISEGGSIDQSLPHIPEIYDYMDNHPSSTSNVKPPELVETISNQQSVDPIPEDYQKLCQLRLKYPKNHIIT